MHLKSGKWQRTICKRFSFEPVPVSFIHVTKETSRNRSRCIGIDHWEQTEAQTATLEWSNTQTDKCLKEALFFPLFTFAMALYASCTCKSCKKCETPPAKKLGNCYCKARFLGLTQMTESIWPNKNYPKRTQPNFILKQLAWTGSQPKLALASQALWPCLLRMPQRYYSYRTQT